MARLRRQNHTGAELADECRAASATQRAAAAHRTSPRKKPTTTYQELKNTSGESSSSDEETMPILRFPSDATGKKKQIRLAPLKSLESSSELFLRASPAISDRPASSDLRAGKPGWTRLISLRKKAVLRKSESSSKQPIAQQRPRSATPVLAAASIPEDLLEDEVDFEKSVWCGSDGSTSSEDDELPSPRKLWAIPPPEEPKPEQRPIPSKLNDAIQELGSLKLDWQHVPTAEVGKANPVVKPQDLSRPSSSSDKENQNAILRFSPPRLYSPPKDRATLRPVTPPPTSPSKSKLISPSKTKARVPTPPLRQSLDAFWNPKTVNDWNDQYSPKKTIQSPQKNRFLSSNGPDFSSASPKKSQSPTKRSKSELQAKKDFETRKHVVAAEFLAELDAHITSGKIAAQSAFTGGVKLLWSRTLNSTAGRANWRRETNKTRQLDGSVTLTHKHHASIELAEKVIDDEVRLLNVLAHEFCHLANFMVSGIKDQPHGASFKSWGRKCTVAFGDRGVEVTTKHSYEIEYKYVWICGVEECGSEFKRHSKSIDPNRHTCGKCRGKLVQIKPVPRKGAEGSGGPTGYAAFVKANYAEVKKGLPPGTSQREVMEALGKKYRAEKEISAGKQPSAAASDLDEVVRSLKVVVLDD